MSALIDVGTAQQAEKKSASARQPEACPVCGRMAEYVERFESGRLMAAHGSVEKVIGKLTVKSAVVCHGFVVEVGR